MNTRTYKFIYTYKSIYTYNILNNLPGGVCRLLYHSNKSRLCIYVYMYVYIWVYIYTCIIENNLPSWVVDYSINKTYTHLHMSTHSQHTNTNPNILGGVSRLSGPQIGAIYQLFSLGPLHSAPGACRKKGMGGWATSVLFNIIHAVIARDIVRARTGMWGWWAL